MLTLTMINIYFNKDAVDIDKLQYFYLIYECKIGKQNNSILCN